MFYTLIFKQSASRNALSWKELEKSGMIERLIEGWKGRMGKELGQDGKQSIRERDAGRDEYIRGGNVRKCVWVRG